MTYFPYKPRAHHCRQIHCKSHSDAPKHPPCSESALDANLPVHAGKYCVRCLLQAPRRGETAPAFGDPGAPRGDVSYLASQAPEVAWEPLCVDGGGAGALQSGATASGDGVCGCWGPCFPGFPVPVTWWEQAEVGARAQRISEEQRAPRGDSGTCVHACVHACVLGEGGRWRTQFKAEGGTKGH